VLPQYPQPEYLVHRFYSRTSSFLKIVPEVEELRCNQQKQVTVHYLLNVDDLEDKTFTASFNYLVCTENILPHLNVMKKLNVNIEGKTYVTEASIFIIKKRVTRQVM
jgi:hypothetical protein